MGQFLGLFLREDCDLGASVLTLGGKKPKKPHPKPNTKKPPKQKKTPPTLIFEMLLFWHVSTKWVYGGRIIGRE